MGGRRWDPGTRRPALSSACWEVLGGRSRCCVGEYAQMQSSCLSSPLTLHQGDGTRGIGSRGIGCVSIMVGLVSVWAKALSHHSSSHPRVTQPWAGPVEDPPHLLPCGGVVELRRSPLGGAGPLLANQLWQWRAGLGTCSPLGFRPSTRSRSLTVIQSGRT